MPRREARLPMNLSGLAHLARPILMSALVVFAMGACSRLSFVRPDLNDFEYTQVAPDFQASDGDRGQSSSRALLATRQGQQALAEGRISEAEDAARQALEFDDRSAPALTLMATIEMRRGREARAGEYYQKAVEAYPRGTSFNNYGIWMCRQAGREAESLEWFNRALADPGYATPSFAMANAGACADKAGQTGRAGKYLDAAIRIDPDNPVALGVMAEREFRAGRAFQARAFSERRLAAAPADPHALMLASQIERQLGDNAAADRYVQRLRAEFPAAAGSDTGESGTP